MQELYATYRLSGCLPSTIIFRKWSPHWGTVVCWLQCLKTPLSHAGSSEQRQVVIKSPSLKSSPSSKQAKQPEATKSRSLNLIAMVSRTVKLQNHEPKAFAVMACGSLQGFSRAIRTKLAYLVERSGAQSDGDMRYYARSGFNTHAAEHAEAQCKVERIHSAA